MNAPSSPPIASTSRSSPSSLPSSPPLPCHSQSSPTSRIEEYLLLLLSDSNLPTGGFVASSGLESFIQHGYINSPTTSSTPTSTTSTSTTEETERGLVEFVEMSLNNYSNLNSEIVKRSFCSIEKFRHDEGKGKEKEKEKGGRLERVMEELYETDRLCEDMILNGISKRASIAQGNALLSLYSRALAPNSKIGGEEGVVELVERVRREVRRGGGWKGHQSTSFGIVMAAVGLSLDRALHLFLFLHARSILSSAVRLNVIGPYLAHRLLLWEVRDLVEKATEEITQSEGVKEEAEEGRTVVEGDWWDNDQEWAFLGEREFGSRGKDPVTTWPLGEIVASRHDQLFTKVFNS